MKGFYQNTKKNEKQIIEAHQKAQRMIRNNPREILKQVTEYKLKRDPNKVEMMENIIWTFLEHETRDYKRNENFCIEKEDGFFQGYLKQCSTLLERICTHESSQIDLIYRRGYTQQKTTDFNTEFVSIYLKRALSDGSTEGTEILEMEYVEKKLGHYGCLLFKNYVALKAARLYIQDKFKHPNESMKKVTTQIKKLESYWEKNVIV